MSFVRDILGSLLKGEAQALDGVSAKDAGTVVDGISPMDLELFSAVAVDAAAKLQTDIENLRQHGADNLITSPDLVRYGEQVGDVFSHWNRPSLLSLVHLAVDIFDLDKAADVTSAAYACAILGEIENPQAFHGNEHYRKVLLLLLSLLYAHNKHYAGSDLELDAQELATIIAAACVHDVGHDGKGNGKGSDHVPYRLERGSYNYVEPYLKHLGIAPEICERILVLLLCTDVSSPDPGQTLSPVDQMVAQYGCWFSANQNINPDLPEELSILKDDQKLSAMSVLLHTADIAISAGLSYERLKEESKLLQEETGLDIIGTPEGYRLFMRAIGKNILLSEAGRRLYQTSYDTIMQAIEKDLQEKEL